jgi:hypothetical protein
VEGAHIDKLGSGGSYLTPIGWFNWYPGSVRKITLYIFPYRYDKAINGKSVRERIFQLFREECFGDLDYDCQITGKDVRILLSRYLITNDTAADVYPDGKINSLDFGMEVKLIK